MTYEQEQRFRILMKRDAQFQRLQARLRMVEREYLRIMQELPEDDREVVDMYISLIEELEYRRTCLALGMPKET